MNSDFAPHIGGKEFFQTPNKHKKGQTFTHRKDVKRILQFAETPAPSNSSPGLSLNRFFGNKRAAPVFAKAEKQFLSHHEGPCMLIMHTQMCTTRATRTRTGRWNKNHGKMDWAPPGADSRDGDSKLVRGFGRHATDFSKKKEYEWRSLAHGHLAPGASRAWRHLPVKRPVYGHVVRLVI